MAACWPRVSGLWLSLAVLVLAAAPGVHGQSRSPLIRVGESLVRDGLRVTFGYLPGSVAHDPPGEVAVGLAIHVQIEVEATPGNPYGLDADESVPYLRIGYTLTHVPSRQRREGVLVPMVSRDGLHYGANLVLPAPGGHTLTVEIRPPEGLVRHTDPRTGVQPWWSPFTLTWDFEYAPK